MWEYKQIPSVSTSLPHSLNRNILKKSSVNGNILKFVHFGFICLLKDNANIKLYFFELLFIHNLSSWESDHYHFTFIFKM